MAFQQHHLGVLMSKQLGKFNFLMELELQNVLHHPEIATIPEEEEEHSEAEESAEGDLSGEGRILCRRTRGWNTITTAFSASVSASSCRPSTGGRITIPTWTLDDAPHLLLRELFPAADWSDAAKVDRKDRRHVEFGVGYKFYVANNNFAGNSRPTARTASRGARAGRFASHQGCAASVAAVDIYRGNVGISNNELAEDDAVGFEMQLEVSQFLFQSGRAASRWGRRAPATTCSWLPDSGSRSTGWSSSSAQNRAG